MSERTCQSCGRTYVARKGRTCGTCRRRRRIAAGEARPLCVKCGERAAHIGRLVCHICRAGGREQWNTYKRRVRAHRAAREGRQLQPRDAMAVFARTQARANARALKSAAQEFAALLYELAVAKCWLPGATRESAEYRLRYQTDADFRAAEIARAQRQKHVVSQQREGGTLTKEHEQQLRSLARTCTYCKRVLTRKTRTLDHVVPLSRGGAHAAANVVACCRNCNSRKSARTPDEWRAAPCR